MSKEAVTPVPAATLMLIRDGADGLEVFMVERHHQIDFATGALVFPGGKIDKADFEPGIRDRCENAARFSELELALRVGGIREAFEECGVLLAHDAGGAGLVAAERLRGLEHYRKKLVDGEITMLEFLLKENLVLLPENLVPFAHWITPPMVPKRFDTHFFIIEAPADHIALHDGHESVDSVWIKPAKVLEEGDAGRRTVIFPTRMNVQKLGHSRSVKEALANARASKIVTVLPQMMKGENGPYLKIPEEAGYDVSIHPCRKGAAKKLLTAVFLALVFLAPDAAPAQTVPGIAPGFATLEEIYTVRNIAVDETADTASAARDIALSAARHTAFSRLTRRIVLPQDLMRVASPTDDALTNLITDFEVADEKSRGQRYLAHLTMRFDPEKVRALFRQSNIRHSETSAKSMLILPVYDDPAGRLLWEANAWRDALRAAVANAGAADDRLSPLLLPLGDVEDVSAVSADQAAAGDMQRLRSIAQRYKADGVLLMHAVQSSGQDTTGGLAFDVTLRHLGAGQETVRIERFEGAPGEATQQILQRAALMLVRGIQEEWLVESALDFSQQASLEVSAQLTSLPEWLAIQKRLTDTPMIQRVDLRALSVTGAQVILHFLGTPEKLASALSQHGLTLSQEAGQWQLR